MFKNKKYTTLKNTIKKYFLEVKSGSSQVTVSRFLNQRIQTPSVNCIN